MNEAEDRLLDFALERHFVGSVETDVSKGVAQAWERGATGSLTPRELAQCVREVERALGPAGARRASGARPFPSRERGATGTWDALTRPVVVVAAAAAVLLAALLAFLATRGDGATDLDPTQRSPEVAEVLPAAPFAASTTDLTVLRGPAHEALRARTAEPGDAVLAVDADVALRLRGGTVVELRAPSLVVLDADRDAVALSVPVGDLRVTTSGAELTVDASFAALRIAAHSDVSLGVGVGREAFDALDEDAARALLDARVDLARALRLEVHAGLLELSHEGTRRELGPSDGPLSLYSGRAPVVADADREAYDRTAPYFFAYGRPMQLVMRAGEAESVTSELLAVLERAPALRDEFRLQVRAGIERGGLALPMLSWLLDVLAEDPHGEAFALARELWIEHPERFAPLHLVAFAERGGFEFERELDALAAEWEDDPTAVGDDALVPAVHLALRGDPVGRPILERWREETDERLVANRLLACFALASLGDDAAWTDGRRDVLDAIDEFVEAGRFDAAYRAIRVLEAFVDAMRDELPPIPRLLRDLRTRAAATIPDDVEDDDRPLWLLSLVEPLRDR